MEFTHLSVLALFCLVMVGTNASLSAEDYWRSSDKPNTPQPKTLSAEYYWESSDKPNSPKPKALSAEYYWDSSDKPNTPQPKALSDLLTHSSGTNLPIKGEEMKQYWTLFFEHDLHPGKKMSLGLDKHSDIQPSGVKGWKGKTSQPLILGLWDEHASQPSRLSSLRGKVMEAERRRVDDFCRSSSAIGEDKFCASSLESMKNFAISKLGKDIKVISSSFSQNHDQYVVEEVKKIGDNMVMCHRMNVEKVVLYCHQTNATTSYMVPLVASDGTKAKALAVCHHDTRGMNTDALYQVFKVKPGTVPVCHFLGNKAILWVPNQVVSDSDHPCVI